MKVFSYIMLVIYKAKGNEEEKRHIKVAERKGNPLAVRFPVRHCPTRLRACIEK